MSKTKITDERRGEYIYAMFEELKKHPDGVERDVLFSNVESVLKLTEFERQGYKSHGGKSRFYVFANFATIGTVKAGWLVKGSTDDPRWRITESGVQAYERFDSPKKFMAENKHQYRTWKKESKTEAEKDHSQPAYGAWLFERLCENEEERASLMRLVSDSMIAANARGPRCWCVTSSPNRIRLNVCFMAVMTIRTQEMFLSVSEELLTPEQKEFLNNYGKKEPDGLKTYPTVRWYRFSRSSFLEHLELMWPLVEAMIQFAGTPKNGRTIWRKAHRHGIGAYIQEMLGIEVPAPVTTKEVDTVAITTPRVLFSKVDYDTQGLLNQLKMGEIGLPEIQRPFVWSSTQVRDLFDSMYRGYPVGYLLFWSNSQLLQDAKTIGMKNKQHKTPARLVVDGQQRLTSLFAVMDGVEVLDKSFKQHRIRIAFRPRDGRFEVSNPDTEKDPEFITDISEVWTSGKPFIGYAVDFIETLRERKPVSKEEQEIFFNNFDRLFGLTKFPFTALEISADVEEDAVAEIFVRINSKGVKLNQADFILTLLSVFWPKGREVLEEFCKQAIQPTSDPGQASPYNHLIAPAPDQLLRVAIAIGFFRARLQNAYQILRGKEVNLGTFSEELRDSQFEILRDSQSVVLDLKHWHLFLNAIRAAGFRSKELISSEAALMYTYVYYLIGTTVYKVPQQTLERLIGRWFYFVSVTARYSGGAETIMDGDLARVKDLSSSDDFVQALEGVMASTLTDDFWQETAPFNLTTALSRNPSMLAFYAAQCKLAAPVLFSDKPVADYFDPTIVAVKKAIEKHHLFPKNWLVGQGKANRKTTDQVANFSYVEWSENIQISDESPAEYVPRLKEVFDSASWEKMSNLHALPDGWERMDYETFLEARRTLIAGVIRRGYESLADDNSAATGVRFVADGSKEEQAIWVLIERLEKRLRKLVLVGYTQRWGGKAESMMREYLGESSTRVIDENRKKAGKAYRLAGDTDSMNEFLDFSYLGQLGQLMMTNEGWTLFREPFKEKRLLQEEMTKITRVRNDAAHFRSVPKLELMRCQIAVADLEKLLDSLSWAPKDEHGK